MQFSLLVVCKIVYIRFSFVKVEFGCFCSLGISICCKFGTHCACVCLRSAKAIVGVFFVVVKEVSILDFTI